MPQTTPEGRAAYQKKYYAANREKQLEYRRAHYQANKKEYSANAYRRKFGIELEEAERMKERGCEICGSDVKMTIDHDHSTGKIRGPLCSRCNTALGMMDDDPHRLRAAADYLEFHRGQT